MTSDNSGFQVSFWGVRGGIPRPGASTVRYGGNTVCVEVQVASQRLLFDAGTGLRDFGETLQGETPVETHLFLTHYHWDHIQGLPFFTPGFTVNSNIQVYGPWGPSGETVERCLQQQMAYPHFPVPLEALRGLKRFTTLSAGDRLLMDHSILIDTADLHHPGGAIGYRLTWKGPRGDRVLAYVVDTEHPAQGLDSNVLKLAQNADLFLYDTTYTPEEYNDPEASKVGWGHSTWAEGIKIARAAQAKELVLFHHNPAHTDTDLDRILEQARQQFPATWAAYEGLTLTLEPCWEDEEVGSRKVEREEPIAAAVGG